MPTAAEYAADYLKGATTLRAAVAGMTKDQLLARPVEGKWSTMEVVAHISDFDPILVDRMKRVIALDRPVFENADENLFAEELKYHERDVNEELAVIDATRTAMSRLMALLSPEQLYRTGLHTTRGPMTLEKIIQLAIRHVNHHVTFIEEKKKALGL
ncbi:DinB family protein [soil metagenome]